MGLAEGNVPFRAPRSCFKTKRKFGFADARFFLNFVNAKLSKSYSVLHYFCATRCWCLYKHWSPQIRTDYKSNAKTTSIRIRRPYSTMIPKSLRISSRIWEFLFENDDFEHAKCLWKWYRFVAFPRAGRTFSMLHLTCAQPRWVSRFCFSPSVGIEVLVCRGRKIRLRTGVVNSELWSPR